ncbi:MAG: MgtC/SapB family protein, partial [Candidatus Omnitrophica bacterium]|nr:MgtC/SapB family protein [Candidatus Omnitrophota bacterium]
MDPNLLELILKISLTIVLSGIIGAERELRHKGAGLRTHVLVCLGSTLIAITSIYLFDKYNSITTIDPTRMITGIIQGVG